jgi:hypothetical protein
MATQRRYDLIAAVLIIAAVCMRLSLLQRGWPDLSSDEGTMGLMARHILYRGEHPIYFYGQAYMGALEAYMGAALFPVVGATAIGLRLGLVGLYALFLTCMYVLATMLYGRKVALVSLLLLSIGTKEILLRQLSAVGGAIETLTFGAALMLLGTWLGTSPPREGYRRSFALAGWGLAAGLGIWSHLLVLPFVAASGLLLILACRKELRTRALLYLVIGLTVGLSPVVAYDAAHSSGQSEATLLYNTFRGSSPGNPAQHTTLGEQIAGTMLVSLPLATGASAFCGLSPEASWPITGSSTSHTRLCTAAHGAWSAALLGIWGLSTLLGARRLAPLWSRRRALSEIERRRAMRELARLLLLAAVGLTLFLYALSPAPAIQPRATARYLVALAIATPALLVLLLGAFRPPRSLASQAARVSGLALAGFVLAVLSIGTLTLIGPETAYTRWRTWEDTALIAGLKRMGAMHIYSDYWTCDRLAFESDERITCAVLDDHLLPGQDRYLPYRSIVRADRMASYVFPITSPQARVFSRRVGVSRRLYSRFELNGYVVWGVSWNYSFAHSDDSAKRLAAPPASTVLRP